VAANRANGRLVAGVNGAVASLLVAVLAVVALVVKPPSPPGIAEFAPQATKPITKAPPGQAAQHGVGPGACAAGQTCAPATTMATTQPTAIPRRTENKGVPSALQCYEWPDGKVTQTFDPQSPPCIASWPEADKGNGGATTRGVTKSEIRVAINKPTLDDEATKDYLDRLFAFFNSRYQLYGRHLRLVPSLGETAVDPSVAHATAQAFLATEAFAAVVKPADDSAVAHELAKNDMLSVSFQRISGRWASSAALRAEAPYAWTFAAPPDLTARNLAAFVCRSLKGKPARFSTGQQGLTRKFVILNNRGNGGGAPRDPGPVTSELASCGLQPEVLTITDADTDTAAQARDSQEAQRLQREGVTTVLSLATCCQQRFEQTAHQAGWHPEWVYDGAGGTYPDVASEASGAAGQESGRLGLAPTNKVLAYTDEPHYRVAPHRAVDTTLYPVLQTLAAGIQMAGPRLSPFTFDQGLKATVFPNPGAGTAPSYQAAASFPADEPWMLRDYAVWWPDVARGRQGAASHEGFHLCYVGQGRRWSLGGWTDIEAKIKGGLRGC